MSEASFANLLIVMLVAVGAPILVASCVGGLRLALDLG